MTSITAVRDYRRRNLPHRLRGWRAEFYSRVGTPKGLVSNIGELRAVVLRHDRLVDLLLEHRELEYLTEYLRWVNLPDRFKAIFAHRPGWRTTADMIELCRLDPRLAPALEDLGVVCRHMVTDAGVAFLTDAFENLVELELMNYHASGTGVVAEAQTDTALGTEVETRETGVQSQPTANQYRTVATHTYAASFAITEHGIFSQLALGGTLWDRSVFSAINVTSGGGIEFTYTLTSNAGG